VLYGGGREHYERLNPPAIYSFRAATAENIRPFEGPDELLKKTRE